MVRRACACALVALLPGCSRTRATLPDAPGAAVPVRAVGSAAAVESAADAILPIVDHHRHLMSPAAAQLIGEAPPEPVTAERLVRWFDEAGMRRAVVLSVAYWFGSPYAAPVEDEYAKVHAENDWTAEQAASFPDRLVAFCSFNPLKDYALAELERCAAHPHLKGVKMHFANSGVNVLDPAHVAKLRQVFRAANRHGLPMVVHLWVPGGTYGRRHSEAFLDSILPEAPDVVVQVAHFVGGGGGYFDDALAPFAAAIAAGDPRVRNVYLDVAAVVDEQSLPLDLLFRFAERVREVGLERILFGSDMTPPPASEPWARFRARVPLTDVEFRAIADNIAPYLR